MKRRLMLRLTETNAAVGDKEAYMGGRGGYGASNQSYWRRSNAKLFFDGDSKDPKDYRYERIALQLDGSLMHFFGNSKAKAEREAANANALVGGNKVVKVSEKGSVANAEKELKKERAEQLRESKAYLQGENKKFEQMRREMKRLENERKKSMKR